MIDGAIVGPEDNPDSSSAKGDGKQAEERKSFQVEGIYL